ncbi:Gfo/Idh/MocA family oxidoreductase [Aliishimia ponticola]|uniref:Gfo/Idh/MocA family oxidoreductase n=1 Tax=Aliishimia ponticola TaxID=2499833 RepID=A0A4S4NBE6_9RHOB|nr:Gfo/Idh/MocA family oxidoreductase [Aliishimia ponticola]THH36726.1 Gfo/Idh/MocA family oxidoreductase [Aliishimia ponticola]
MTEPTILVLGSGSIGTRHADNIEALGARADRVSLRAMGQDGVLRHIETADAQGAVIATATQLRLPLVTACAARGLPVYIEKPLAYRPEELAALYDALAPISDRSMAGFMMRYHPLLPALQEAVQAAQVYRFDAEIGHDVTQWRQNWSFAESYAALPEGGGVLLDLCHELDLAHVLFPDSAVKDVLSLGHSRFPGVDMATQIELAGPSVTGSVSMDYLSPVSLRRMRLRGQSAAIEVDMLASRFTTYRPDTAPDITEKPFERNTMFMDAMRDFLALIAGQAPSAAAPRVELARLSCEKIATAWATRSFTGTIEKEFA